MKKVSFILVVFLGLMVLLAGCIEIEELDYVRFETYPKTTYLKNESLEHFEVTYQITGEDSVTTSSANEMVVIEGFDTSTIGTFTMTLYISGFEDVTLNFVYTVVNSLQDLLFAGGTGTQADPYEITTAQHLSNLRLFLNNYSIFFEIMNDIDLADMNWVPIGGVTLVSCGEQCVRADTTVSSFFAGHLEGNGHTISNLTISGQTYAGLFAASDEATFQNFKLTNVDITNSLRAGALTTYGYGVNVSNVDVDGEIHVTQSAGGLVYAYGGYRSVVYESFIEDCEIEVDIYSSMSGVNMTYPYVQLGGIIGQSFVVTTATDTHELEISNSSYSGTITIAYNSGTIGSFAGFIIGYANIGSDSPRPSGKVMLNKVAVSGTSQIYANANASQGYAFYGYASTGPDTYDSEPSWHEANQSLYSNIYGYIGNCKLTQGHLLIDSVVINQE